MEHSQQQIDETNLFRALLRSRYTKQQTNVEQWQWPRLSTKAEFWKKIPRQPRLTEKVTLIIEAAVGGSEKNEHGKQRQTAESDEQAGMMNNTTFRSMSRELGQRWVRGDDTRRVRPSDANDTYWYLLGMAEGLRDDMLSSTQTDVLHRLCLGLTGNWDSVQDSADSLRQTGRDTSFYGMKVALLVGQHIEVCHEVLLRFGEKRTRSIVSKDGEDVCLALLVLEDNDAQKVLPAEDDMPQLVCWSSEGGSILVGEVPMFYALLDPAFLDPDLRERVTACNEVIFSQPS